MSEKRKGPPGESHRSPSEEAWREMGKQFQQLGESLSAAFRAAWNDEHVRRQAEHAKGGLEALATEVGKVVSEMAQSPDIRRATSGAVKSARTAGEETVQEIRPHLEDALRQINRELQRFVDRMHAGEASSKEPGGPPSSGPK